MDGRSPVPAASTDVLAADALKRAAAAAALDHVESGMRLGLGTGSTANHFVALLGERVRSGLKVVGVPTSERTGAMAREFGIPLTTLDETPELDLAVDGTDEIDSALRMIKGGGGALLREKIVASASRAMLVIADHTKKVAVLGAFPLPIEVVPFGLETTRRAIVRAAAAAGCNGEVRLRRLENGQALATDSGHVILDGAFGAIADPEGLADRLAAIPGVVEHGLFIGLAREALIAGPDGIELLAR